MFESLMSPLTEKWNSLAHRDQAALKILITSLLLAFFIFGLIVPTLNGKQQKIAELASAKETYQQLVELAPLALANSSSAPAASVNDLNSIVRRQAARNGFEIQRFEPSGDSLKVWLEDVRYRSVVLWLGALQQSGVFHSELTMEDRANAGFVSVRVTLYAQQ
ncbi:type II secretion system protein GspM [Reinekea marinisedimentorum]|uniref:Type II secretory pathway component PulM n=1 Tax=Reinekea marinisedimentorum TaxID=230495 RepID=A0A4R3ID19_9GAMM|nr:type II secretion system protein GspM [Reinekea marinisedimentorum]TCS42535.1 type II secretory pathway component PulM [Reinekea marinisedimentorum]